MGRREEKGEMQAFLGKGTEFNGTLLFDGVVRLEGKMEGVVRSDDGHLVVGKDAELKVEIEVGSAQVAGTVFGNIKAKEKLEVLSTGRVVGNIATSKLAIDEGARFTGECVMEPKPLEAERLVIPMEMDKDTA